MTGRGMRFARYVFIGAGVWGVIVLTPLFVLVDLSGKHWPPPSSYPHFFYGFLAIAMAWQVAFLIIGSDPLRFRPLMIAGILEKVGFVIITAVLYVRARITAADASVAVPDALLGILFVAAYLKTPQSRR
jgi:hypothetical protein